MANEKRRKGRATKEQPTRRVQMVGAEEAPIIYANNIQLNTSIYDFILGLGQIMDVNEERLLVKTQVKVAMSPQHAKSLAIIIMRQVDKYEQQFGELPTAIGDEDDVEEHDVQ